jgi:hypothetical protein
VVLLFDEELIKAGKRLYPFDTGAFITNRYENWIHPKMKLTDFELKCTMEAPRKHVAAFFGTNQNYLKTRTKKEMKAHSGEFEVQALIDLFQEHAPKVKREERIDDRRMVIELQVDSGIEINAHPLLAVIYPDELEQASWFKKFMYESSSTVVFRDYRLNVNQLASDYQALLEDRSFDIQRKLGLV